MKVRDAKILIIDDDKIICKLLSDKIRDMGYDVKYAFTLKDGLEEASKGIFDVIFLDVMLPDGNGLDVLANIQKSSSSPEVIIITATGDCDGANFAIKNGAWDYIEKPCSIQKLTLQLVRALQFREGKKAVKPPAALKLGGIIGKSQKMIACFDLLTSASNSDVNVLITGETGTGKELFAQAIHNNSERSENNFVTVDCAALPETLVESMLLGYEKGAFTGADRPQEGLIRQADGGTLFLDEVGELHLSLQKAFLRVLQEHRFRPLGSKREVESNFRLVAATNRNLDEMVQSGQFRKDLLFRLRSFTIDLPPLKERSEDIKEMTIFHITRLCKHYGMEKKKISPEFFEVLSVYDWPGNVRELINTLEKAIVEASYEPILFPKHLPTNIRIKATQAFMVENPLDEKSFEETVNLPKTFPKLRDLRKETIAKVEKEYFQKLMIFTDGKIKEVCAISGLNRSRLYELLNKYHILEESERKFKSF